MERGTRIEKGPTNVRIGHLALRWRIALRREPRGSRVGAPFGCSRADSGVQLLARHNDKGDCVEASSRAATHGALAYVRDYLSTRSANVCTVFQLRMVDVVPSVRSK